MHKPSTVGYALAPFFREVSENLGSGFWGGGSGGKLFKVYGAGLSVDLFRVEG